MVSALPEVSVEVALSLPTDIAGEQPPPKIPALDEIRESWPDPLCAVKGAMTNPNVDRVA